MGAQRLHKRGLQGRRFWALVKAQHGVVARAQLAGLGASPAEIDLGIRSGRLHPVHEGVFAAGRPELGQLGRWRAAVLACGPMALLSHGSAAALWGIEPGETRGLEVLVPYSTVRLRPGLLTHRSRRIEGEDRAERLGIPATSPARTVLDLAARLTSVRTEAAVNSVGQLGLASPDELRSFALSRRGLPGAAPLRRLLDRYAFELTDSELERKFLRLVRSAKLPSPEVGASVNGFKVDFLWRDLGIVVETDGLTYHRMPQRQTRDRRRDQTHSAAGLVPLRFTHWQVAKEPSEVVKVLRAVANQRL